MRPANLLHLGIKELRSLWRDPVLLGLIVYAFTVAIYAGATAVPETLNRAPIAIVDEDRSPLSLRITEAFYPPYFLPPALIGAAEMDARLDAGIDTFALDVPPSFERDLLAGRAPAIQLNVDATRMSQAFAGSRYIQTIIGDEITAALRRQGRSTPPPVELVLRSRFNPELNKMWFGAIVQIVNNVTMLALVLTGAALIREREHGTIEHLLVMPVSPFEIMLAKVWSMALVVLAGCAAALLFVAEGMLGMPIEGSVTLFLTAAALHLFATASLGIFLATVARSMPQFGLLVILVMLPLQMLSGGMTPRESMPEAVQLLMLAAPTTHIVMIAQAVLFRGAGLSVVWPQLAALAAIAALLFGYALTRLRVMIAST